MLTNAYVSLTALALMLSAASPALGRERWMERDNRPVRLGARRFGQEHPPEIDQIAKACGGGACDTLAGQAISTLLAANPECGQQDFADSIIDASKGRSADEAAAMVAAAVAFRQAEKNSPPDFTTNPPTNRNTVFCQKSPKNPELNGLVQRQDPANSPDFFFDPATKATVKPGEQANTKPFAGAGAAVGAAPAASATESLTSAAAATTTAAAAASTTSAAVATDCVASTVTVTVDPTATTAPTGTTTSAAAAATTTGAGAVGGATAANLQTFTGTLGGSLPPTVFQVGDKFQVTGNALFNAKQNAIVRSCDVQHNTCANAANASGNKAPLTVDACGTQQTDCNNNAAKSA